MGNVSRRRARVSTNSTRSISEKLKEEQRHNLELKTELCVKVEELSSEILTTRKEWNKASERLIEIQKVWKTIGFAPQKDNARIYERFRNACDKFFEQKREFYERVKTEMDTNLQAQDRNMRTGRIAAGERTVEEDDRRTDSAPEKMERDWSRTAPLFGCCLEAVPRSVRPFLRTQVSPLLRRGRPARGEPAGETGAADGDGSGRHQRRRIRNDKGVPKTLERNRVRTLRQKDEVQQRYRAVVDGMFATLRGGERERSMDRFRVKVSDMKGSGDKRLRFERDRLYNKVKQARERHRHTGEQHRVLLAFQKRRSHDTRSGGQDNQSETGDGRYHRKDKVNRFTTGARG